LPTADRPDLDLLLSETVANAVKHGDAAPTTAILVEGELNGRNLGVEVTNAGMPFAHVPDLPPDTDIGGRGLVLVDALAERWGTRHECGSTTVWFELDVDR
jgi:anti-sigma regulatory factor (Ser/Thr protein kinase)